MKQGPNWMGGQEAMNELMDHFLGEGWGNQFDWIQNGAANAIAVQEIKKKYPKWLVKLCRAWNRITHILS